MSACLASFRVHGIPAPQGSKRHVGRGIMVESSQRVRPWREAVKHAYLVGNVPHRFEGPVAIEVHFAFDKPKSAPKKKPSWPTTRTTGDLDKLLRSTFDALVDAGCIKDDAQVVFATASKSYTVEHETPGARIDVWDETQTVAQQKATP